MVLLHHMLAWSLTAALALSLLSLVTDGLLVGRSSGVRAAFASGLTGAALGTLLALALGPGVALLVDGLGWLQRTRLRSLWLFCVIVLALVAGVLITHALYRPRLGPYGLIIAGTTAAIALAAVLARATARWPRLAVALALALALVSSTVDVRSSRVYFRDLHDLLALVTFIAVVAAASPLRRRLARAPLGSTTLVAALLAALALVELRVVDRVAPGWRPRSWLYARWQPVLGRLARGLVDLDGDGFSPVAWGGDCDDADPQRSPLARDLPGDGIDQNCNGVDPPKISSDAQRGLGAPRGRPDLPDGAVERVLLVTIDCLRGDMLTPELMPHLTARARTGGITFTRLYSAGSRTNLSLPLLMRGTDGEPPIGERLARAQISSTVVFAWDDRVLQEKSLAGMGHWITPNQSERRFRAPEVTDRALEDLAANAGHRHFQWLHYFDAHDARAPVPGMAARPTPPGLPSDYGQYLTELTFIDQELERLLSSLEQSDELKRTVVIVTGDHGEGFGAHGLRHHGVSAYEELVHVPGVLLAPPLRGRRYDGVVSHRDVPATVLGAFGLVRAQPDVERFGRSWLRLVGAPNAQLHLFVIARSMRASRGDELSAMPMATLVDGRRKLIITFEDGLRELYDPIADPHEQHDLLPAEPHEADRLTEEIQLYRDLDGWP